MQNAAKLYLPLVINDYSNSKNALKLSSMFGIFFEIYWSQMIENALKLSAMVETNFKIYTSQLAKVETRCNFRLSWTFPFPFFLIFRLLRTLLG